MKANDFTPPPHLRAEDLDANADTVVTIESCQMEEVGANKEVTGTLKLKEFPRTFVVNRGNNKRLSKLFGDETDNWVGKQISLYVVDTEFRGEAMKGIRVRQE